MDNEYKLFIKECIKNRKFLEFTYEDMSNCLNKISASDYESFEKGIYKMSKENLIRIVRVLCIKKPVSKDFLKDLDLSELDEEQIKDISKVVNAIVGDDNA